MTTGYYSSLDLDALATPYAGRLTEPPVVTRRLVDALWGPIAVEEVSLALANADGALTAAYLADLRGRTLVLKRYDRISGTTLTEWTGQVAHAALRPGRLELTGATINLAVLDDEIPKGSVTTTTWPKAVDVGATIPVVLGNVATVPLPYVNDDVLNDQYDYLVGHGTLSVSAVYRDGSDGLLAAVTPAEYTTSTVLYPGYTVLRFTNRQENFSGGLHKLYADVTGLSAERNFARAVRTLLSSTTWGLSQTVNAASFDAAEAVLAGLSTPIYCDGALLAPQAAQDVLRWLLMVRGMRLGVNSSGEWTLTVDQASGAIRLRASDGEGDGERTLLAAGRRTRPAQDERVKRLLIRYRQNLLTDVWQFEQSRTLASAGRDQIEEHPFIRVHATADVVCDYLGKRLSYGEETVDVELSQEARQLAEGELVNLTCPWLGYSDTVLQALRVDKRAGAIGATLAGWSAGIYTYTPGTLPSDASSGAVTDYSRVTPDEITSLSIAASGTEQASDGGTRAFVRLQFTTPTTNCAGARVDVRKNGETVYQTGWALGSETGAAVQVKVAGLEPGLVYDYRVVSLNAFGLTSAGATLSNQLAPGDTAAPATPATPTVLSKQNKTITFQWTAGTEDDLKEYEWDVRTASGGGGSLLASGKASIGKVTVNLANTGAVYGTTYYFRCRALDFTGNASAYATAVSFALTRSVTDDIDDGAINENKRTAVYSGTITVSSQAAGSIQSYDFTHSKGRTMLAIAGVNSATLTVVNVLPQPTDPTNGIRVYVENLSGAPNSGTVELRYW